MPLSVYALKCNNEILAQSSSGGAFLTLAKVLFHKSNNNASIYGVIFDTNMKPIYSCANNYTDCYAFCGSKYVTCPVNGIISSIVDDLKGGKSVLFVGTPCNVAALKAYIRKNGIGDELLYTVDLICNGTPPLKLWEDYVLWLEKKVGRKLINFKFRKKGDSRNPYLTAAYFEDNVIKEDKNYTACYNQLFLKKISIRKSCFNCKYKRIDRVSDITIGDFWGIEKVMPEFCEKTEVSEILVNTKKGMEVIALIEECFDDNIKIMECKTEDYLQFQKNLTTKSDIPMDYQRFWDIYKKRGFEKAMARFSDSDMLGVFKYQLRKLSRLVRSLMI